MADVNTNKKKMVVAIVGGVAGGASAAARLRRMRPIEDLEIVLFERGEFVSFANCGLAYHIGGHIKEKEKLLVATPEVLRSKFQIDVRISTEVVRIIPEKKEIVARALATNVETVLAYDTLILSPGASPIRPPIPGIDHSRIRVLRDIPSMDVIKHLVVEAKQQSPLLPVLVLGGGYIGLEVAEALVAQKVPCMLVEYAKQVMGPIDPEMSYPLHQELNANGVDLRLGCTVEKFLGTEKAVFCKLTSGEEVTCSFAIIAIGVKPDVDLAKQAGLKIGERGGIVVDEFMQTSDPSIYAVGDAIEVKDFVCGNQVHIPLAGPANRQGRLVASNLFAKTPEARRSYKNTQGTAVCKVIDATVAMTGANEKTLIRLKMPYTKVYAHAMHHASYYPGAQMISLKLLYNPENGKILGAQAVGKEGVEKRIDVIAVAIRANMTVFDLEDLELCYAPPYGSAKDPVNMLGFIASNVMRGEFKQIFSDELQSLLSAENKAPFILDVREPEELHSGMIPSAVGIPMNQVISRMHELPKDREIVVYCASGLRSYVITRALVNHGFSVRNFSGGFKMWVWCTSNDPKKWVKPYVPSEVKHTPIEAASRAPQPSAVIKEVDATGLQCPGPIMRVAKEFSIINAGQTIAVTATDSGFAHDLPAWCKSTGNTLVSMEKVKGGYRAVLSKGISLVNASEPAIREDVESSPQTVARSCCSATMSPVSSKKKTIVVFGNNFDKVMAAFIIANGAAAMGSEVTMFFTFWGLTVLKKRGAVVLKKKGWLDWMMGLWLPIGTAGTSQMNYGGAGPAFFKHVMATHNITPVEELIEQAKKAGVHLVACTMAMDLLGITKEELMDGVEFGGVAAYLSVAEEGSVNLFIG